MFGWFGPTCPCDPAAKRWVEDSLRWLARQFGYHILLERPIILPTAEFFPDPWDGSPKAARKIFRRVCSYMGVDDDAVELNSSTTRRRKHPQVGSFARFRGSDLVARRRAVAKVNDPRGKGGPGPRGRTRRLLGP